MNIRLKKTAMLTDLSIITSQYGVYSPSKSKHWADKIKKLLLKILFEKLKF